MSLSGAAAAKIPQRLNRTSFFYKTVLGVAALLAVMLLACLVQNILLLQRSSSFMDGLRVGLTLPEVNRIASAHHLQSAQADTRGLMVVRYIIGQQWKIGTPCDATYTVALLFRRNHVIRWREEKRSLCL